MISIKQFVDERQNRDDDEDLLYCQQEQHQGVRMRSCQKQKSGRSSLPPSLLSPRCSDSEAGKEEIENHSWFWQYINLDQTGALFQFFAHCY